MKPLRVVASLAAVASVVASGAWWMTNRRGSTGASGASGSISAIRKGSFLARNGELARLGLKVGGTYASASARKVFASAERRVEIDHETELKSAQQVSERLGDMKGALMKLGQMASYLDEGLPAPLRAALSQLQSSAPPMSAELAAQVIERELGAPPEQIFLEWDPEPLAAASIGQVHRAVLLVDGAERAVAVKVQYPGVDQAIDADLKNADLLGFLLQQGFSGLDPTEMVEEVKSRIREELDYRLEARNQTLFAEWFADHPFIRVPRVYHDLSTHRVLTTELVAGHSWSWVKEQSQEYRDRVGETLFRFVFRSLYGMHKFNGDPHPGNYLFHDDGSVTFLDFGLVKHFTDDEMTTFIAMVRTAAYDRDIPAFRSVLESSGMLKSDAPVNTDDVGTYFGRFYQPVSDDREITWTSTYASSIVRHTFDRTSPIAQYATVPKTFVFIQRINLGLYAILGELGARGNYRRVAEELWPFVAGPPSTELGELEAHWMASRHTEADTHQ
jgi:predicted unusual protein kinase regulating ubiquinone biosynthesis (AarF/ABC1/UbiB family)